MTNKKFRDDLAKEMRDKYNERNEKLEQAEKSSFSDGLKEQMKKEIMDNFTQEMEEMKSRPGYAEAKKTHLEEIKAKIGVNAAKKEKERLQKEYEEKLAKADADISDKNKVYEDAQIAHRGEVEQKITANSENKETSEIPQSLLDFRKKWEEEIDLDEDTKKEIIDAVNEIQKGAKEESDGSILVEFELGGKGYKTLDVNVAEHSDDGYFALYNYDWCKKSVVRLGGMRGDNTKDRKNRTLAEFVDKQRDTRDMEIRTIEFQRDLINKLGAKAGLTKMSDKIAMWMYLTGNYGLYFLSMGNYEKSDPKGSSCSGLGCTENGSYRSFGYDNGDIYAASLCLIACQ